MARSNEPDRWGSLPSLYAITPQWPLDRLLPQLAELTRTSNTIVQVRDKGLPDDAIAARAQAVVDTCRATSTVCIVNDRPEIAAHVGAHGVHVGAGDASVADARTIMKDGLVGATCRTFDQAQRAVADGADYLGVGPIFPTISKTGLPEPLGLDTLAEITATITIPVYAIGGITVERAAGVIQAGAHGVAAISALFSGDTSTAVNAAAFERAMATATRLPDTSLTET